MLLGPTPVGDEMPHVETAGDEGIGDEAPMASPPQRLGAHHRHTPAEGRTLQLIEPAEKLGRLHVLGVGRERRVAPRARRTAAAPTTTQLVAEPSIGDPGPSQRGGEDLAAEVRVASRAGITPHVDEKDDAGAGHQGDEVIDRPRAVADGPDREPGSPRYVAYRRFTV